MLADTAMITLERPQRRSVRADRPTPTLGRRRRVPPNACWPPRPPPRGCARSGLASLSQTPVPPELATAAFTNPTPVPTDELRSLQVLRLRRTTAELDRLANVMVSPGKLIDNYTAAAQRAASSAWIPDPAWCPGLTAGAAATTCAVTRAKLRIIGRSLVTLSSSHGTIPVTVSNGLSQAVQVRPQIRSLVPGLAAHRHPRIAHHHGRAQESVQIPAEAAANGISRLEVVLLDAAGQTRSPRRCRFGVNVTNYGSVGLIVVIGGGGLLFTVAVVRNIRRVRAARQNRRAADGAAGAGAAPGGEQKVQA